MRLMRYFFEGWDEAEFDRQGEAFAKQELQGLIRPAAWTYLQERLSPHNERVVVSASMEAWLKPWCDLHGIALLCTRMERREGKITGRFATPNCYGAEKVRRLEHAFDLKGYKEIHAFGDSRGDRELLAFADHGFYRYFH